MPCPLPGDLPDPGIEPINLMSPALEGGFFTTSTTWEAPVFHLPLVHFTRLLCVWLDFQFPAGWPVTDQRHECGF